MSESVTAASVRKLFEDAGASFVRSGLAGGFEVVDADGVRLVVRRHPDGNTASVAMTGTSEVFFLDLDGRYRDQGTAYDAAGKAEIVDDFLAAVKLFLARDYHEEIEERNGIVVRRTIVLGTGDSRRTLSTRVGPVNRVRLLLGTTKTLRRGQAGTR
jgi:hypothetical protein